MFDKIIEMLKMPGYIRKKEIKIDIPEEDIFKWIKQGKLRVRSDGYVEVVDGRIINEIADEHAEEVKRSIRKLENG